MFCLLLVVFTFFFDTLNYCKHRLSGIANRIFLFCLILILTESVISLVEMGLFILMEAMFYLILRFTIILILQCYPKNYGC